MAANAAFTASAQAAQKVSAASLAAPATAAISMTCDNRFLWWARSKITVSSYTAVARANYYDIKLFNPSGSAETTGDLSTVPAQPYSYTSGTQLMGTWKYEIRAYYKVPGTTNIWSGEPLKGSLTCP